MMDVIGPSTASRDVSIYSKSITHSTFQTRHVVAIKETSPRFTGNRVYETEKATEKSFVCVFNPHLYCSCQCNEPCRAWDWYAVFAERAH